MIKWSEITPLAWVGIAIAAFVAIGLLLGLIDRIRPDLQVTRAGREGIFQKRDDKQRIDTLSNPTHKAPAEKQRSSSLIDRIQRWGAGTITT
jgi:hypothetical protein